MWFETSGHGGWREREREEVAAMKHIILIAFDNGFLLVPKCKEDESTREGMDIISWTSWYYDGR